MKTLKTLGTLTLLLLSGVAQASSARFCEAVDESGSTLQIRTLPRSPNSHSVTYKFLPRGILYFHAQEGADDGGVYTAKNFLLFQGDELVGTLAISKKEKTCGRGACVQDPAAKTHAKLTLGSEVVSFICEE